MWEYGDNGKPQIFVARNITQRCPICGQFFKNGDEFYSIVCNSVPEARAKRLHNMSSHTSCWDNFCKGAVSDKDLAIKLKNNRIPKCEPLTEEQKKEVAAFKKAAESFRYKRFEKTRDGGIKARKRRSSAILVFYPYLRMLEYHESRDVNYFKSISHRQLVEIVHSRMQEILDDGRMAKSIPTIEMAGLQENL